MTRIKAPNGDIYDLDPAVASGLLGSVDSGWKKIDDPAPDIPRAQGAKVPGPGRGAHPAEVHRPADDAPIEEWNAYADHINLDRNGLDRDGLIAAVNEREQNPPTGVQDTGKGVDGSGESSSSGDTGSTGAVAEPPAGNASVKDWADYANALGVDIAGLEKRGEIRAAIEKHQSATK